MKRIVSQLLLLLACCATVQAADLIPYRPLVEEGKWWTYDNFMALRPDKYNHYYWYQLKGDTVIAGQKCLKMYSENRVNDSITRYEGALYELDRRVYHFEAGKEEARLLYDFACNEGDEVHTPEGVAKVVDIRSIERAGRTLRCFELQPLGAGMDGLTFQWLEGVGCTSDFFAMFPWVGNNNSLTACQLNGEPLYQYVEPDWTEAGYQKMGIEGKTWNYMSYQWNDEAGSLISKPYSYVVQGDTLIGRTTCKKVYYRDADGKRLAFVMGEFGREVLKCYPGEDGWHSFFVFDRDDVGRVFDWQHHYADDMRVYWMVNAIDTVNVNGVDRRRYTCYEKMILNGQPGQLTTIVDAEDVIHDIWVEGIGSLEGGIEKPDYEQRIIPGVDRTEFLSCYENGQCIYSRDTEIMAYRPFIEEGKVWKVGWFPGGGNTAMRLEYYYFEGDTVIDNRTCKRMMCLHKNNEASLQEGEAKEWTEYVGALFEEDRQVFHAPKDDATLHLLYDFKAAVGDSIQIYNTERGTIPCIVVLREPESEESHKGMYLQLAACQELWDDKQQKAVWAYDFAHPFTWREGVGACSVPLWNFVNPSWVGNGYSLMSCTVGDEVLYRDMNLDLKDELDDSTTGNKARKRRLDFTHTVKTRPKSPRRVQATDTATEAALTGEYSLTALTVSFLALQGCYSVTICDADGEAVYDKTVQTSNTIALNTLLSQYAQGEYTLIVENDSECYTASFRLPLDGDGIRVAGGQPSPRATSAVYDLSGRQVVKRSARKGIYIQNGHKVIQ